MSKSKYQTKIINNLPLLLNGVSELEISIERLEKLIYSESFRKNCHKLSSIYTIVQYATMVEIRDALRIRISTAQQYQNN
jgi:hypothetical protein